METLSRLVFAFVLNGLWQISLLALAAGISAWLLKHAPAKYRNGIWTTALALSLLLPVASLRQKQNANSNFSAFRVASGPTGAASLGVVPAGFQSPQSRSVGTSTQLSARNETTAATSALASWLRPAAYEVPFAFGSGFLVLCWWMVSLGIAVARLGSAWRQTIQIRRSAWARSLPPGMARAAARCRAALGLAEIPISFSAKIAGPMTWGAWRPMILLPANLRGEDSEETLMSIFAHEMAHIRRHDYLLNLLSEILSLPISFHPAVWLLKRRISRTRELACDEIATRSVGAPSDYAHSLVALARRISSFARPGYTLGIFDANILEERVKKLLDQNHRLSRKWARLALAAGLGMIGASCVLAFAFSLGIEQDGKVADDPLAQFVGTWQGKRFGQTIVKAVIREQDQKLTGEVDFYHVTLDETGKLVEVASVPAVSKLTQPHVEGTTVIFSFQNADGDEHQVSIHLSGTDEAQFEVIGAPPPPGEPGQSAPGITLRRETESGSEPLDELKPFTGAWEAKMLGKPIVRLSLMISGQKASGGIDVYGVTLDAGKAVGVDDEPEQCQVTAAKAEGNKAMLSGYCAHMGDREFELTRKSDQELEFKVVGAPPPPDENGESHPAVKLTKMPKPAAEVPAGLAPYAGTWDATFQGKPFTTLVLGAAGDKLKGTLSACHITLDGAGKLTSAARGEAGQGWEIIEASLNGDALHVRAKEATSEDVDEFEMKLTGNGKAEFKPAGTPMPVEPWPMTRVKVYEYGNSAHVY